MEDVFTAYSQGYDAMLNQEATPMRISLALQAINSVAVKEFIHIYRDWRILVLLLILPPVFTLIFGHAFESTGVERSAGAAGKSRPVSPRAKNSSGNLRPRKPSTGEWQTRSAGDRICCTKGCRPRSLFRRVGV